jgi:NADH pyrophosphatase NudC (nudix superfamily)
MCVTNHTSLKTARCVLHRQGHYLLAVHSSFWGVKERRWGLPGGQIERGETPQAAVQRELHEELSLQNLTFVELGAYPYKRANHMVFAAQVHGDIPDYDTTELLDIQWFSEPEVATLHSKGKLHANYELDAIRALRRHLTD